MTVSPRAALFLLANCLVAAGASGLVRHLFGDLSDETLAAIVGAGFLVTLPPNLGFVLLARARPQLAAAVVMLGIFMRLTALGVISIWLRVEQPDALRSGLFAYLIFVGSFLLFEIVALPALGLHKPGALAPSGKGKEK